MIIGLVGYKQVGKSTAAEYLKEKYGFARHNFKDQLVAELKQNFPDVLQQLVELYYPERMLPDETAHEDWIEQLFIDKPAIMRALMQNYGTEVRRGDNQDYWTDQWVKNLPGGHVVTDDVRFLNEAFEVENQDGILVRLTRPDITTGGTHASEREQEDIICSHTIDCEPGDHEKLYAELDKLMQ